jgi:hypothetical protein
MTISQDRSIVRSDTRGCRSRVQRSRCSDHPFRDGTGGHYDQTRTGTGRKLRSRIGQIQALGFEVTLAKTPVTHTAPDQTRSPRQARVAVIPGSASGASGHIRISFASEIAQLQERLARIGCVSAAVMDAGPRGMQHEWTHR